MGLAGLPNPARVRSTLRLIQVLSARFFHCLLAGVEGLAIDNNGDTRTSGLQESTAGKVFHSCNVYWHWSMPSILVLSLGLDGVA